MVLTVVRCGASPGVSLPIEISLLVVGHHLGHPAPVIVGIPASHAGRELLVRVVEVVKGQSHLFQVVHALGACGGVAYLLHCRDKQCNQDGDDRDDHQKLDQGEPYSLARAYHVGSSIEGEKRSKKTVK